MTVASTIGRARGATLSPFCRSIVYQSSKKKKVKLRVDYIKTRYHAGILVLYLHTGGNHGWGLFRHEAFDCERRRQVHLVHQVQHVDIESWILKELCCYVVDDRFGRWRIRVLGSWDMCLR